MTSIGKYQILNEIGPSVAGKTYRARDTFRNRELALKVLPLSPIAEAERKDHIRREFGACSELRHSHIAEINEAGEVDGNIYVATDLLAGVDLPRYFQEHPALALVRKLELTVQVCDALALAHSKGIAHGNIKPSNILVVADEVKVLDFGTGKWLAAILEAGDPPAGFLPHYLAPEQILGQPFDAKSDVFSVALVLYELLSGNYPFPVAASLIPREIVHTDPEPLRKLNPELPEELESLVVRALNKNPEQRVQTAEELGTGLRAIVTRLSAPPQPEAAVAASALVPAPAPPEPPKIVPHTSGGLRKRVLVYCAAAVLVLAVVGIILSGVLFSRPNTRTAPAKNAGPANLTRPAVPAKQETPALTPAPPRAEALKGVPMVPPPGEQIQFDEVRSLWQSGKYAQAMQLVDTILVASPANAEARAWKKKIRAAQAAEEAIK